jgi:hypothetical protein
MTALNGRRGRAIPLLILWALVFSHCAGLEKRYHVSRHERLRMQARCEAQARAEREPDRAKPQSTRAASRTGAAIKNEAGGTTASCTMSGCECKPGAKRKRARSVSPIGRNLKVRAQPQGQAQLSIKGDENEQRR